MPSDLGRPARLSIIVFSGDFPRVHYALALASAAAATNMPATLFFTMGAIHALRRADGQGNPGWHRLSPGEAGLPPAEGERAFMAKGVATFSELLSACAELGVAFMVCEMGLRAEGLTAADLRTDIPYVEGGIVSLLAAAGEKGQVLFI
jgi:Uncharacterized conserved protein